MRSFAVALAVAVLAVPALGQDGGTPPPSGPVGDYRWAVYTACTVAFLAITAFLLVTHARSRKTAEDLAALERRLDALEAPKRP